MQWIKALRPLCGIATSLLVISGFRHGHQPTNWSVVVTVFFGTCLAMLWNDYHDRELDIAKGRFLASRHPIWFLRYTLVFAVISFCCSIFVWSRNPSHGMLCMGLWISSMFYPAVQKNPVSKNLIPSLNTAATIMFPLLADGKIFILWFMAVLLAIVMSMREFMKDIEDMEVDRGRKQTLALVMNCHVEKRFAIRLRIILNLLLVAMMI